MIDRVQARPDDTSCAAENLSSRPERGVIAGGTGKRGRIENRYRE